VSGNASTEPTRRRLTERQADTVRRLTTAGVQEVRTSGYPGLDRAQRGHQGRGHAAHADHAAGTGYTSDNRIADRLTETAELIMERVS